MEQVFYAQPMEESIMGKEIYEVVRRSTDGGLLQTAYRCMSEDAAIEKARELNEEHNNQI